MRATRADVAIAAHMAVFPAALVVSGWLAAVVVSSATVLSVVVARADRRVTS